MEDLSIHYPFLPFLISLFNYVTVNSQTFILCFELLSNLSASFSHFISSLVTKSTLSWFLCPFVFPCHCWFWFSLMSLSFFEQFHDFLNHSGLMNIFYSSPSVTHYLGIPGSFPNNGLRSQDLSTGYSYCNCNVAASSFSSAKKTWK